MKEYIKKYPISLFLVVAIWIICLIPIPETPLDDVPMIDKWTHFVMYGSLCSVMFGYMWSVITYYYGWLNRIGTSILHWRQSQR